LRDEDVESLFAEQPCRFLLALRQWWRDGEEVADEKGKCFGGDGDVASDLAPLRRLTTWSNFAASSRERKIL
jgi:hypothetical protein